MFDNLGWAEIVVLGVLGILIFGPERLPKAAADAARLIRELRRMAQGVTSDLREEFREEIDELRALDPRRVLDEGAPGAPTRPPALAPGERAPFDPDAT